MPQLPLPDGATIPQLGFGTYLVPPEDTTATVTTALEVGFRHLDTAQMYGNEEGVGAAIAASGLDRADLYLATKLANDAHRPDDVRRTFEESLTRLGLDYLDLFLMHWPLPTKYDGDFVSTWTAMTDLVADGRLRSVGVSNFEPSHLDRIIDETDIAPVVNQIEVHPYFANTTTREASLAKGVLVEAWGPLGQGAVLDDSVLVGIGNDLGRSASQVALRWHVQRGDIIFPKSMRRERMEQNLAIFDFVLTEDQMAAIDALDRGPEGRGGPHPDTFDWV